MKTQSVLCVLLAGLIVAFIATTWSSTTAQAQDCFNQLQQPVACPGQKDKKKNTNPLPTAIPATAAATPNSIQPGGAQPVGNTASNTNCTQNPVASSGSNGGAGSPSGTPFSGFVLGGGGLLLGVLIGLFIPSLIGAPTGSMRGVPPARSGGSVPTTGGDEDRPGGGC